MDQVRDLRPEEGTVVEMAGQTIRCQVIGEQTGGAMAVLEATLGPGLLCAPPHMHRREDEVLVLLEGELTVQVGERVIRAAPGEFVFMPRGVRHGSWNPGSVMARYLVFISPAGFEEYFRELAPLFPTDGPPDVPGAVELAWKYEVDFDLGRVPEILEQHGVKAAWLTSGDSVEGHKRGEVEPTVERSPTCHSRGVAPIQAPAG
jgi:mannose-6-phosphate isomerase-like protein (cupin superfamily)